jgi:shikimate kinase
MGSGKSTVGPHLAAGLGRAFIDLDQLIVETDGRTIPEIFEQEGEAAFRKVETECLRQAATGPAAVIALGGGGYLEAANRRLMRDTGITVWLQASLETVRIRALGDGNRPLARDGQKFEDLYLRRLAVYGQADLHISTEGRTPESIGEELASRLEACIA